MKKEYDPPRLLILISALVGFLPSAFAQAAPEAQVESGTGEAALGSQIELTKTYLAQRQVRAGQLRGELLAKDARVEDSIEKILEMLGSVTDSSDSGTKTIRMKKEVIDALAKSIERYRQKRAELKMEVLKTNPSVEEDDIKAGIAAMDRRIEKRVDQILSLTASLATSNDYAKYVTTFRETRRDEFKRTYRRNEAYDQARKAESSAREAENATVSALEQSIETLERRNRELQSWLENPQYSDEQKALIRKEIEHNEVLVNTRYDQLEAALAHAAGAAGGQREISLSEAMELDRLINDAASDLQWDINSIFRIYNELVVEKQKIAMLQDRLDVLEKKAAMEEPSS